MNKKIIKIITIILTFLFFINKINALSLEDITLSNNSINRRYHIILEVLDKNNIYKYKDISSNYLLNAEITNNILNVSADNYFNCFSLRRSDNAWINTDFKMTLSYNLETLYKIVYTNVEIIGYEIEENSTTGITNKVASEVAKVIENLYENDIKFWQIMLALIVLNYIIYLITYTLTHTKFYF